MNDMDMVPTLRDRMAMAALTGIMSCEEAAMVAGGTSIAIAVASYNLADAMMKAREVSNA